MNSVLLNYCYIFNHEPCIYKWWRGKWRTTAQQIQNPTITEILLADFKIKLLAQWVAISNTTQSATVPRATPSLIKLRSFAIVGADYQQIRIRPSPPNTVRLPWHLWQLIHHPRPDSVHSPLLSGWSNHQHWSIGHTHRTISLFRVSCIFCLSVFCVLAAHVKQQ